MPSNQNLHLTKVAVLTSSVIIISTTAAVLTLADAARERNGITVVDPRIATETLSLRDSALTVLAHVLTFLGSEIVVGGLAVVLLLVLLVRRQIVPAFTLALAIGGSVTLTIAVKQLVMRVRPGPVDVLGPVDHSFSFPSGHTLNSTVFIGVVVYLLARRFQQPLKRTLIVVSGIGLAAGVGLSRIYLGYHWATDVIASWLIAVAWLTIVLLITSALGTEVERRTSPHLNRILRR